MVAWKVLSADTRIIFRTTLSVDESTWARARGWALSQALMALSYYTPETNPMLVREATSGWRRYSPIPRRWDDPYDLVRVIRQRRSTKGAEMRQAFMSIEKGFSTSEGMTLAAKNAELGDLGACRRR